jgi:hypothetical protein
MAALMIGACRSAYVSPSANATLEPLDRRIVDLERLVRGCYRITGWAEVGSLSFRAPTTFVLDTTVEIHDRYYRRLRMTPIGFPGGGASWSVKLPDSVWLEWREPPRGLMYGGVYANGVRRGDTLRGTALRYSDVSTGRDPRTSFVAVRSACPPA